MNRADFRGKTDDEKVALLVESAAGALRSQYGGVDKVKEEITLSCLGFTAKWNGKKFVKVSEELK